jgi:hypothetical protein
VTSFDLFIVLDVIAGAVADPADEFAGAAGSLVVRERALEDPALLDFRMLMEGKRRSGRTFQQAGLFARLFVLVQNFDLNTFEL